MHVNTNSDPSVRRLEEILDNPLIIEDTEHPLYGADFNKGRWSFVIYGRSDATPMQIMRLKEGDFEIRELSGVEETVYAAYSRVFPHLSRIKEGVISNGKHSIYFNQSS